MNDDEIYRVFINLAEDVFVNQKTEGDLKASALQLPPITIPLLNKLGDRAEEFAISQPRRGWTIAKIAYSASIAQNQDLYTRSLAAWYLGRASNHWGQPKLVKSIISRSRKGFLKLNEIGWVAACDWQLYILSWTRSDIPTGVKTLKNALKTLQLHGFDEFVPHCRLALAYAQLLMGKYDEAMENIHDSEAVFQAVGDQLNQARCWLNVASCLRRQDRFNESLTKLHDALKIFDNEDAHVDIAKTYYQLGLCHLIMADDLSLASDQLNKSIELFAAHEMDLWQATGTTNLGYIYLLTGSLEQANKCFEQARKSFIRHNVPGLLADNLNDSGKLNTLRGFPSISIKQFYQAEELHKSLGLKLPAAIDAANLGEAYGFIGRYQDALHHLERATEQFQILNNPIRLGACEKFIVLVWVQLGQLDIALEHLNKAATCYEVSNQKAMLSSIYNDRASISFLQNDHSKAIEYLLLSLEVATANGVRPQAAIARRLLGEAFSRGEENEQALDYLKQAHSEFLEIGMVMEQAATLVAIGTYYAQRDQDDKSRESFEKALQISEDTMPEIDWRAHAGLANLARRQNDLYSEFYSYDQAIESLRKIRDNFWQPSLVGSYLQMPLIVFDNAISRAASLKDAETVLQYIEQNKATTLLAQLKMSRDSVKNNKTSQEMIRLKAEINWLWDKLNHSFDSSHPIKFAVQTRNFRSRLKEKARMYDALLSRLERRDNARQSTSVVPDKFDLNQFRQIAGSALGKSWIALDYYIAEETMVITVITPNKCLVQSYPVTKRFAMALEACAINKQPMHLSQHDLNILGDFLIPSSVAELLTPDTYLLIVPHKELHSIPWSAIQSSVTSKSLIHSCILSIAPSLHSLYILWQRTKRTQDRNRGLVVGVSTFHGSNKDLPSVKYEAATLSARLSPGGNLLVESDATWDNLKRKIGSIRKGESRFSWLHFATHFFVDPQTGRLSGIRDRILDAQSEFSQMRIKYLNTGAKIEIWYTSMCPIFTLYRFDIASIIALYSYQRAKSGVPHIVAVKGGSLYDFVEKQFNALTDTSVGLNRRIV